MFAVGRARIQVSFTGGHLGDGCSTPAKYTTSDPVVQKVIENSEHFRNGRIRVGAVYEEPAPKPSYSKPAIQKTAAKESPKETPASQKSAQQSLFDTDEGLTAMEFESYVAAGLYLQDHENVDKKLLLEDESIDAEARKRGIKLIIKNQ